MTMPYWERAVYNDSPIIVIITNTQKFAIDSFNWVSIL